MTRQSTLGRVASSIRSKNAGPFWITLDVFFDDDADYQAVIESSAVTPVAVANLYGVAPDAVQVFHMPALRVIKVSFPRPHAQGTVAERDMHAGQQHIPLASIEVV